ncbi:MAG: site-specific DNA-methyltransferase, partial [Thermoplasmata archaeon]
MTNKVAEERFWNILEDLFIGAKVEGKSGYVNLLKIKSKYFEKYLTPNLREYIDEKLKAFPDFKEELYDQLYSFFHRYFSESGGIYYSYTPLYY